MEVPAPIQAARERFDQLARRAPARLAVVTFGAVVGLFVALLMIPAATASGRQAPLEDAVFTAASAVCVTGLTTVPTATYWSGLGQAIILVGIKIGGLGVMTLASLLGMAVSRRIGLTQRILAASETKSTGLGEVASLLRVVILTSTTLEACIAVVLIPRFLARGEGVGDAVWHGVFYAVSAFNNAGFVPHSEGFEEIASDLWIGLPIALGVFLGSLGFPVILNIARRRTQVSRWSLHTKLTLVMSAGLAVLGSVVIASFEWGNPATFGRLDGGGRFVAVVFAGIMPRSGGFSTIDIGEMRPGSHLMTDALMFVGGGSASTAGGIRVTTMAVLLLAILSESRGDRDMEAFGRRIPRETLRLDVAVAFIGATSVGFGTLLLLQITGLGLDAVLFEVISAFATVGLSTGITPDLPVAAKYVLAALMFVGRTGTMTMAAALALRDRRRVIRYPEERPIIG